MPPRAKKTETCNPTNNALCPEIIELRVIVRNIGESVIDMQHLILGNGKDGMKIEQSKQSELIKQLDSKVDKILAEQKVISDERIARNAREKLEAKQKTDDDKKQAELKKAEEKKLEDKKTNKQWTWRWVLGLAFDKFTAPIIVAIVLYLMLGGK